MCHAYRGATAHPAFSRPWQSLNQVGAARQYVVLRSFLSNAGPKRNHRWPLRSVITLNGHTLPHVQVPQAWDGVQSKDKNEDQPLIIPARLLRIEANHLQINSQDAAGHLLALLTCAPRPVDSVIEGV